jgi:hypothetical protein
LISRIAATWSTLSGDARSALWAALAVIPDPPKKTAKGGATNARGPIVALVPAEVGGTE